MRPLFGIVLAVILAVTSQSAAFARGQAGPAGTMVICRGLTVSTVLVDADGQPMQVQHICPDAALALFVATGMVPPPTARSLVWRSVTWDAPPQVSGLLVSIAARARGPPAFL
ncbi:hypothetical protein [Antarctobacter heliothermus]|uniref:Uncharacterized protein n=1 Tax=Antarctobacter heliothermus TaxID=74033 RepID=A0A239J6R7_9RHOB|nr:hypothetical protein [Antarctobacter heliothermus]SNT00344.1 hypothetical protein SAMN04488078_104831 [Antarctobacter heliothermus]